MKLIEPTFEIVEQEAGLEGIYKQIEKAGRVCYASEPIEGKAKDFVDRLINLGHTSVLEHGTVYLRCDYDVDEGPYSAAYNMWDRYKKNYLVALQIQPIPGIPKGYVAITTNYRVLVENNWLDDLEFLCDPTDHEKRVTVKLTCDRGVSHKQFVA